MGDLECRECICDQINHTRTTTAERGGRNLAVLILGHRKRLAFDSLLPRVIEVNVRQGHRVAVFIYLETGSMAAPYVDYAVGEVGSLQSHPAFRDATNLLPQRRENISVYRDCSDGCQRRVLGRCSFAR